MFKRSIKAVLALTTLFIATQAFEFKLTKEETHQHNLALRHEPSLLDFEMAQVRAYDRREKLGLSTPLGASVDESQSGLTGQALGFISGIQYNSRKASTCYTALHTVILDMDAVLNLFTMVYLPENWAKLFEAGLDMTNEYSVIYDKCNILKLINVISELVSTEGGSTLMTRIGGGMIFEIPTYYNNYNAATTDFEKGKWLGKIFSLSFNYYI